MKNPRTQLIRHNNACFANLTTYWYKTSHIQQAHIILTLET